MRKVAGAAVADVVCVLVFVAIGRSSHDEAASVTGFLNTAWPFLGGALLGWLGSRAWRAPAALVPSGLVIWAAAVAGGMLLRVVSGQGTAVAFVIVATLFLGLVLLGWRAVAALLARRTRTA